MERFLTLQYYFTPRPDPDFQFTKLVLAFIILFYLAAFAVWLYRKKYAKNPIIRKMIRHYPIRFLSFGSVLLFLLLSREVGLPFLSMRIWWFVLIIVFISWAAKIGLNFKKEYRSRLSKNEKKIKNSKYLPKKKKK